MKEIKGVDEMNEDECPWIKYDLESKDYKKEIDSEEALSRWLDVKYG